MAMSKKDFKTIAESIRMMMDPTARLNAAVAVASACVKLNPRFEILEFFEACGVGVSNCRVYHLPKE